MTLAEIQVLINNRFDATNQIATKNQEEIIKYIEAKDQNRDKIKSTLHEILEAGQSSTTNNKEKIEKSIQNIKNLIDEGNSMDINFINEQNETEYIRNTIPDQRSQKKFLGSTFLTPSNTWMKFFISTSIAKQLQNKGITKNNAEEKQEEIRSTIKSFLETLPRQVTKLYSFENIDDEKEAINKHIYKSIISLLPVK